MAGFEFSVDLEPRRVVSADVRQFLLGLTETVVRFHVQQHPQPAPSPTRKLEKALLLALWAYTAAATDIRPSFAHLLYPALLAMGKDGELPPAGAG